MHVITEGSNKGNRKNKRKAEDVLFIHQELWGKQEVRFDPANKVVGFFQNDPSVIKVLLNWYEVRQVLVDTISYVNILILNVFNKLDLDKNSLARALSYSRIKRQDCDSIGHY